VLVARLTVECHKFLNRLFLQQYYPWALAYYSPTQFSVPCLQNINLCQYWLSQITYFAFTTQPNTLKDWGMGVLVSQAQDRKLKVGL